MSLRSLLKTYQRCRRMKKSNLIFPVCTKIHGVKTPDKQGALAQSAENDELQFVHVPLNEYPHNTYVYSITLNRILGYLDKELAEKLLYIFGEGFCLDGQIDKILGGPPLKYRGATVLVYEDNVMMQNCDLSHLYE